MWRQATGYRKYHGSGHHVEILSNAEYAQHGNDVEWLRTWDLVFSFSWYDPRMAYGMRRCCALVTADGYRRPLEKDPLRVAADWRLLGATQQRNNRYAASHLPLFDGLLAANNEFHEDLLEKGYSPVYYAPGGVDHELFKPDTSVGHDVGKCERLFIGWCGHVTPGMPNVKGYELLLEPMRKLFDDKKGSNIAWKVNTTSIGNCAVRARSMPDWYRQCDVFLVTSVAEGTPLTALEAMACGRPVIGTSVGVLPELIEDGVNGFLIPAYHDAPSRDKSMYRMRERIMHLQEDRDLLKKMGAEARRTVEHEWSWAVRAAEYTAAFEAICEAT